MGIRRENNYVCARLLVPAFQNKRYIKHYYPDHVPAPVHVPSPVHVPETMKFRCARNEVAHLRSAAPELLLIESA